MTQALATYQPARLRSLADLLDRVELDDAARFARRFADDVEKQAATILIAGEFKRGKSSLVNALIGEELLPVDIVPTTAVTHILHHGERGLTLHWRDGRRESRTLDARHLKDLASNEAGGTLNPEDIEFAEITLPSPRLANGLVLVDTPGTNDMSQMRSEVVYQMIPRADAVVFVLDGTTQLTASEKTFLTDKLLTSLAPPLCFVLNKMDRVDADEQEEILAEARTALREHLPVQDLTIVPCSTRDGVIGVGNLNGFVDAFLTGGERHLAAERKRERVVQELKAMVRREIELRERLSKESVGSLQRQLEEVKAASEQLDAKWNRFRSYLGQAGMEALEPMIRQSFRHHCEEFDRRMQSQVATMPPQIMVKQVPLMVEDAFKGWLNRKVPELHAFLTRYHTAMMHEFTTVFSSNALPKGLGAAPLSLSLDGFRIEGQVDAGECELATVSRFGIPGVGAIAGFFLGGPIGGMIGGAIGNLIATEAQKGKAEESQQRLALVVRELVSQEGERFLQSVIEALDAYMIQFANGLERAARTLSLEAQQRLQESLRHAEATETDRSAQSQKWELVQKDLDAI